MITTAMILAAGRGERLRPFTDTMPKPLLPAGPRRLIEWHLMRLQEAGIKRVVINLHWLGEKIEQALGNGANYGLEITYSHETTLLNTGGGIAQALPLLGQEPFLLINGDIWCDYPFASLSLAEQNEANLVVVPNPPQHPDGDFALSNGALREKQSGQTSYTYSGIAIFHPRAFVSAPCCAFPLIDIIRKLIANNSCQATLFHGVWADIGTPERLQQLQNQLCCL